jgi:hypothetical protein
MSIQEEREHRRQDALAEKDIRAGQLHDADMAQIAARDAEVAARHAVHLLAVDPAALHTRPEIGAALRASAAATLYASTVVRKPVKTRYVQHVYGHGHNQCGTDKHTDHITFHMINTHKESSTPNIRAHSLQLRSCAGVPS